MPLADPIPGCRACEGSTAGRCIAHAGGKAIPDPDDERRCVAIGKHGGRCKKWALRGGDKCRFHDTESQNALKRAAHGMPAKSAERSRLVKAAREHLAMVGRSTRGIDPLAELERLAAEAIDLKEWFRSRLTESVLIDEADDVIVGERITLYTAALERASKLVEAHGKHGLERRIVEMRSELAAIVAALVNELLAVYVPADRQDEAKAMVVRQVRAIEGVAA